MLLLRPKAGAEYEAIAVAVADQLIPVEDADGIDNLVTEIHLPQAAGACPKTWADSMVSDASSFVSSPILYVDGGIPAYIGSQC